MLAVFVIEAVITIVPGMEMVSGETDIPEMWMESPLAPQSE